MRILLPWVRLAWLSSPAQGDPSSSPQCHPCSPCPLPGPKGTAAPGTAGRAAGRPGERVVPRRLRPVPARSWKIAVPEPVAPGSPGSRHGCSVHSETPVLTLRGVLLGEGVLPLHLLYLRRKEFPCSEET